MGDTTGKPASVDPTNVGGRQGQNADSSTTTEDLTEKRPPQHPITTSEGLGWPVQIIAAVCSLAGVVLAVVLVATQLDSQLWKSRFLSSTKYVATLVFCLILAGIAPLVSLIDAELRRRDHRAQAAARDNGYD